MVSCHSSIDSSLPASRIVSKAQWKLIKSISVGVKNEPNNYRIMEWSNNTVDFFKLLRSKLKFLQDNLILHEIHVQ